MVVDGNGRNAGLARSDVRLIEVPAAMSLEFVDIDWRGRRVRIEHRWIARGRSQAPLVVFLHEGLGSLSMWRDFPDALCAAAGARGLVYSRPGYGRSTPRPAGEPLLPDYLHRQAEEVLPSVLVTLGLDTAREPIWLYGHSDGGSIALIFAARRIGRAAGLVVAAPHIMVEDVTIGGIERARQRYVSITEAGAQEGIDFQFDRIERTPNTIASHRLILRAGREGLQAPAIDGVFDAYFTQGRDIGDPDVLADIGAAAGLDRAALRAYLDGEEDVERIVAEDEMARSIGIGGVPCFIVDRKYAVSGAQAPEVFHQVFDLVLQDGREVAAE